MNNRTLTLTLLLVFVAVAALAACAPSQNAAPSAALTIDDVWARQSPMDAGNGAVYMLIKGGSEADALIGASTDVSEVVELHETTMMDDVMRMRPVEGQRIEIPANGSVELKPGGLHVMLIGLKEQLQPGDTFDLVLRFEKAGERTIPVEVRAVEGMDMGEDGEMPMDHSN